MTFTDTDKDHLFALLERQTRLLVMNVEINSRKDKHLTSEEKEEIEEIKGYLNK